MHVEHQSIVPALPQAILSYILDPTYYQDLVPRLDQVVDVEVLTIRELDAHSTERIARYTARPRLPRFLKRFEDKAPEFVHWEERALVDVTGHRLTYQIVPEIPERWNQVYSNHGELKIIAEATGQTSRVVQTMEFSISVPGLSMFITRAIRSELETIFEVQAQVLREHFTTSD
ncbi:hypothetical protein DL240_07700 [Lujinxingia litoralis]|uniref:DUF2505 domain-containing protein n=1 Tax=Lujinxingia litoralis TaxID=2211119 RepID=A0A328C846_9DELT|nr:hypothetical protein [Lujinxingia litoralis]RAL22774.1 hypothetical protein DL240_07700 [Lujinxingia litoralis]